MQHKKHFMLVMTLIMAVFVLAACGSAPEETEKEAPYVLEAIEGTDINRIILTEKAEERLGIEIATLADGSDGKEIPYAAIVYDIQGDTWVYVRTAALTYERTSVTVDRINDETAILTDGPETGTEIVIVGVAELYGTDTGVGK